MILALCLTSAILTVTTLFFLLTLLGWCVEGWTPGDGLSIALLILSVVGFYQTYTRAHVALEKCDGIHTEAAR